MGNKKLKVHQNVDTGKQAISEIDERIKAFKLLKKSMQLHADEYGRDLASETHKRNDERKKIIQSIKRFPELKKLTEVGLSMYFEYMLGGNKKGIQFEASIKINDRCSVRFYSKSVEIFDKSSSELREKFNQIHDDFIEFKTKMEA